jgi:hypothetical protein
MGKHNTAEESVVTRRIANRKQTVGIDLGLGAVATAYWTSGARCWRRAAWRRLRRALPRCLDRNRGVDWRWRWGPILPG